MKTDVLEKRIFKTPEVLQVVNVTRGKIDNYRKQGILNLQENPIRWNYKEILFTFLLSKLNEFKTNSEVIAFAKFCKEEKSNFLNELCEADKLIFSCNKDEPITIVFITEFEKKDEKNEKLTSNEGNVLIEIDDEKESAFILTNATVVDLNFLRKELNDKFFTKKLKGISIDT